MFWSNWWMKVCILIYTRNYKQGSLYYIQETKTTSENFFRLLLKGKVLLRKELKLITLYHFNYYLSNKCSLSKKQLILMIVKYSDLIWFIPCAMLNPNKAGLFEGKLFWMTAIFNSHFIRKLFKTKACSITDM